MLPVTGKHIIIRELQPDDLEAAYALEADPLVKLHVGGPTQHGRQEWVEGVRKKLDRIRDAQVAMVQCKEQHFAIVDMETGLLVGTAWLVQPADMQVLDKNVQEIRIVTSSRCRGRHFGREACEMLCGYAFDVLKAERVIGIVSPENKRCLRLLDELGFRKFGVVTSAEKTASSWQYGHLKYELLPTGQ